MQLEINVVDAFTDTVFRGNSAAVIITDSWLDVELMQSMPLKTIYRKRPLSLLIIKGFIIFVGFRH